MCLGLKKYAHSYQELFFYLLNKSFLTGYLLCQVLCWGLGLQERMGQNVCPEGLCPQHALMCLLLSWSYSLISGGREKEGGRGQEKRTQVTTEAGGQSFGEQKWVMRTCRVAFQARGWRASSSPASSANPSVPRRASTPRCRLVAVFEGSQNRQMRRPWHLRYSNAAA